MVGQARRGTGSTNSGRALVGGTGLLRKVRLRHRPGSSPSVIGTARVTDPTPAFRFRQGRGASGFRFRPCLRRVARPLAKSMIFISFLFGRVICRNPAATRKPSPRLALAACRRRRSAGRVRAGAGVFWRPCGRAYSPSHRARHEARSGRMHRTASRCRQAANATSRAQARLVGDPSNARGEPRSAYFFFGFGLGVAGGASPPSNSASLRASSASRSRAARSLAACLPATSSSRPSACCRAAAS